MRTVANTIGLITNAPHALILRVEITGGFFNEVLLELVDGIYVVIGERGSGKSTVTDIVRYCLGLEAELNEDAMSRVRKNLGGGVVRVTFQTRGGAVYLVSRRFGAPPAVSKPDGAPANVAMDKFRVVALGQNDLERYSTDAATQLALVDYATGDEIVKKTERAAQIERELRQHAATILRVEEEVTSLSTRADEGATLEQELAVLEQGEGPDAKLIQEAHARKGMREREAHAFGAVDASITTARTRFTDVVASSRNDFASCLSPELEAGPNGDLIAPIASGMRKMLDALEHLATEFARQADALGRTVDDQRGMITQRHAAQDMEYAQFLAKQKEHSSRAADRVSRQQRFAVVAPAKRELEARETELRRARAVFDAQLEELRELRLARSEARSQTAIRLSKEVAPGTQVVLTQAADKTAVAELLWKGLAGTVKEKKVAQNLAEKIAAEDFVEAVRKHDIRPLMEKAGEKKERAERICAAMLEKREILLQLEMVESPDVAKVRFKHGEHWKELKEGSPGQKAAALMSLLLITESCPFLIDQPEDSVGPKFLTGTNMERLDGLRGHRQFFIATYSANLVVIGKADWVAEVACALGDHGTLAAEGDRFTMVERILEVLEGGEAAFEERRAFYTEARKTLAARRGDKKGGE